ncbi:MAG: prolipoprotein diacylglyceryl transferase, partial [Nanoarchaeota archaeon]|nr:prolipoprotein diacylglyceryl transferase [Nanoarchaeota archaeon]
NSSGDLLVYPVLVAMMIGRIGCLLTGVYDNTVGVETDFFLGFDQGDGLSRHPTSLYEIVFLALLFFVLKNIETSKTLLPGDLFKLFLSGYLLFRFCIDFLKPYPEVFLGLGSLQIACLLVLLYYAKIFIQRFFFSSQHG